MNTVISGTGVAVGTAVAVGSACVVGVSTLVRAGFKSSGLGADEGLVEQPAASKVMISVTMIIVCFRNL